MLPAISLLKGGGGGWQGRLINKILPCPEEFREEITAPQPPRLQKERTVEQSKCPVQVKVKGNIGCCWGGAGG